MEGVRSRAQVRARSLVNTHMQHTRAKYTCNTHVQHSPATHTWSLHMQHTQATHAQGHGTRTQGCETHTHVQLAHVAMGGVRVRALVHAYTHCTHTLVTLTQGYGGRVCAPAGVRAHVHTRPHTCNTSCWRPPPCDPVQGDGERVRRCAYTHAHTHMRTRTHTRTQHTLLETCHLVIQ